jgi:DNA-binding MarR family transcriptional regulator
MHAELLASWQLACCMMTEIQAVDMDLLGFYRILTRFIEQDDHPLTIRQLAMLLTCYLPDEEHTVRWMAAKFGAAKPAVSRMLDHLVDEGLIERRTNPSDRRSILFECTSAGTMFLQRIRP